MPDFVHLHAHSHYTLLESTTTVKGLVAQTKTLGMDAVALTDRGNLFGAFEFASECKDKGLKGIIGCQVNVAPLGMREKTRDTHQLVLLAESEAGYANLTKLVSKGWLEGFYFEPRIDLECLAKHSDGLLCLTGAGRDAFINRHLLVGAHDEAQRQLGLLRDVFADRLWLEVTDHGVEGPVSALAANRALSAASGVPLVATNWVHYLTRETAGMHDVQLAIQKVTTLSDTRRKRMPASEFYLKSAAEMESLFAELPEAIRSTRAIAERCAQSVIHTGTYHLPTFACPEGRSEESWLRELCARGIRRRYGDAPGPEVAERLAFEVDTIAKMGFCAYFLIVADFINWAKDRGIPVGPGRGSAAGSIVAYAMGITDMCPLRYGLLFERFLNPGRKSMPDIDIDFCKDRRGEVIEYVANKYGHDAVTQIMTLGTMKARMAIKDVARAYEWSPEEAQDLANLVTEDPSGKHTLAVCLGKKPLDKEKGVYDAVDAMVKRYEADHRTKDVLDTAMALEGLGRSLGVHACGIIIAPGPVSDYVPVCSVKGKAATQYNMSQVEKCGLLKMDFLGLKTMSILKKTADIVRASEGVEIDFEKVPLDDPRTFALLGTGETLGVFQCESSGFQELIKMLKPDRFEDLIALVALYRPGPLMANMHISYCDRKHGREKVEYPHPVLEKSLKETYGLYIYQEQVMNISRELCGFTPAQADDLRKAMGKKDVNVLKKVEEQFVEGAWSLHRFDKAKGKEMFEKILGFASYCFNKSHSACYGLIAYWTAWAKANHYAAFMTANLIYEMDNKDKMTLFVERLRSAEVPVLPPDINESGWEFTLVTSSLSGADIPAGLGGSRAAAMAGGAHPPAHVSQEADRPTANDKKVRFGFGGVKGIGEAAANALITERTTHGPYTSLYDLCARIDTRAVNKRVVEHAIKVGACDSLHPNRRALVEAVDRAFDRGAKLTKTRKDSQETLFGTFEDDAAFKQETQGYPDVPDFPQNERLAFEKALTGYWISSHPVAEQRRTLSSFTAADSRDLPRLATGSTTTIAAVIIGKRVIRTKTGKMMAVLTLEDPYGRFEGVLFAGGQQRRGQIEAGPYDKFAHECADDVVALFTGKVERRERRRQAAPPPSEGEEELPVDLADAGDEAAVQHEEVKQELPSLIIADVIPADLVVERLTREIHLALDVAEYDRVRVERTELLFKENQGQCPVRLIVHTPNDVLLTLALGDRWRVHPSRALVDQLREIWGPRHVRVQAHHAQATATSAA
jgi:DNA polymerase-3 subunit alpha